MYICIYKYLCCVVLCASVCVCLCACACVRVRSINVFICERSQRMVYLRSALIVTWSLQRRLEAWIAFSNTNKRRVAKISGDPKISFMLIVPPQVENMFSPCFAFGLCICLMFIRDCDDFAIGNKQMRTLTETTSKWMIPTMTGTNFNFLKFSELDKLIHFYRNVMIRLCFISSDLHFSIGHLYILTKLSIMKTFCEYTYKYKYCINTTINRTHTLLCVES